MRRTARGFRIFSQMIDTYGATIRVQESSAACRPRIWLFCSGGGTVNGDPNASSDPHLTPAQARRLARRLLVAADHMEGKQ